MRKRYLIFLLIFVFLGGVFALLRGILSEAVNTTLIAVGEGRSIRVDNTDMVKRKQEKQVRVKGAAKSARAAQVKVAREEAKTIPCTKLVPDKRRQKVSRNLFVQQWVIQGFFPLVNTARKKDLNSYMQNPLLNDKIDAVQFGKTKEKQLWHSAQILAASGRFDLADVYRRNKKAAAAYLIADVETDQEYSHALMQIQHTQYIRVFLNGEQVFATAPKAVNTVPVKLKQGKNRIVIKTASANGRSWYFSLRFFADKKLPLIPRQ